MNYSNSYTYPSGHNYPTYNYNNTCVNLETYYGEVGRQFCDYYYNLYDNNYLSLANLYSSTACITFMSEEFIGFSSCSARLRQYNITKFTHHNISYDVQPVGSNALLITASGVISVNDSIYTQRFVETIVVQRTGNSNNFYVSNSVFKLID